MATNVPAEVDENLPKAQMPAEASETAPEVEVADVDTHPVMAGFNRLSVVRQAALVVGIALIIVLIVAVILWSRETPYRPVVTNMQEYNAKEIIEKLETDGIDFNINPTTGVLMVAEGDVNKARLSLASILVDKNETTGLEMLDKDQGLGTSQFIENARYRRGLEGELARTIASLTSVRNARVHLALPKQSVFVRDTREPRASVFLELYGGKGLSKDQAEAIINLVASSVPELKVENVTLVDQKGNLLSKSDDKQEDLQATRQFDYTRKVEDNMNQRVQRILEPVLGAENFQAEVSADVDFTQVEQTQELYNPDLIALRSEQTMNQETTNKPDGGVPGALSNQPPGAATTPEKAPAGKDATAETPVERRSEATRNYEVDRTLSHTQHQTGRLRRLTVSVAVNDIVSTNPETGERTVTPWSEADLKRVEMLVKDAVGFDAARGDSVSVVNSQFRGGNNELGEPDFWTQPWFWDIVKQVLVGLFILILIFGVIRPVVKNLINKGKEEEAAAGELDELGAGDDIFGDDRVTLAGADEFLLPGASEGFERQLDALKGLIAEDPARVASAMKKWVNADA
ncbi:MAG: flagellar M-ring protein FliF [Oceanospirillaceae bacterium]|nr:flagellar M-ring protein FliF [Oceanospirillaceae bacterium]MCP5350089.1 flagellar M-ring protein FliF [Oceanospirillaceae bacterium]